MDLYRIKARCADGGIKMKDLANDIRLSGVPCTSVQLSVATRDPKLPSHYKILERADKLLKEKKL